MNNKERFICAGIALLLTFIIFSVSGVFGGFIFIKDDNESQSISMGNMDYEVGFYTGGLGGEFLYFAGEDFTDETAGAGFNVSVTNKSTIDTQLRIRIFVGLTTYRLKANPSFPYTAGELFAINADGYYVSAINADGSLKPEFSPAAGRDFYTFDPVQNPSSPGFYEPADNSPSSYLQVQLISAFTFNSTDKAYYYNVSINNGIITPPANPAAGNLIADKIFTSFIPSGGNLSYDMMIGGAKAEFPVLFIKIIAEAKQAYVFNWTMMDEELIALGI